MSMITMGHATVLSCIKNLKNDYNIESFKIKSDDSFILRRGVKRWKMVSEETTQMNKRAHSHVSIMTNPIEDAELVLNLSRSPNKKSESPCRSTISNYANLAITNDD